MQRQVPVERCFFFFRVLANGPIRMIGTQRACGDEEVLGDENGTVCGL